MRTVLAVPPVGGRVQRTCLTCRPDSQFLGILSLHRNLTELQVSVLVDEFNLADGHAFRSWSPAERAVIEAAPTMFKEFDRRVHRSIEERYYRTFFSLAEQTLNPSHFTQFPYFTASTGIEVIANFLRLRSLSVALIEPCFDNLKDILRRHDIPLTSFPDELMTADPSVLREFLERTTADAFFLVSPNNPTGAHLPEDNFRTIVEFCAEHDRILILDACFRFYLPAHEVYDQYEILIGSTVDCIVIEDTGKTWPTLEIKAPFISTSPHLTPSIAKIDSDFLLHVSPFAIRLVDGFLRTSAADGRSHIRGIVEHNRDVLRRHLEPTFLRQVERSFMSVSWLRIDCDMRAVELVEHLARANVHVLPGNQFFWSDASVGDGFIRVALMRDAVMFEAAAILLAGVCSSLDERVLR